MPRKKPKNWKDKISLEDACYLDRVGAYSSLRAVKNYAKRAASPYDPTPLDTKIEEIAKKLGFPLEIKP